ncbi:DUF3560 domain-containing protein [Pseudomonas syringae pv. coryli]|uniref:DUF3560 domain-containing protein n=1 Tax=Pseudomonas syringae pv. coryli TaxID=317659 RepID=UPI003D2A1FE7
MQFLSATYSPEDNKLRLYATSRLDAELYARVSAAGFKYAPKQELFYAPAWTPGRADLLVELCGEIGDEGKTVAERAEERAERFEGYQSKRIADAERARSGVSAIADNIPLGQPILVGHHSERRARKDAEKIENGMRRAVQMWDTAEYWQARAAGAVRNAQYKERPDVRHRRIKTIAAEKRKQERALKDSQACLKMWSNTELDKTKAMAIANFDHVSFRLNPDDTFFTSIWSALESSKIDVTRAQELAVKVHTTRIARAERWIAHYENRIGYERAMLGESGGVAGERFDIQPGGRVLIGGEWLVVVRATKRDGKTTSVTTNARFVRVRGIEEVSDYRAPTAEDTAKIKAAKKLPPLCNFPGEGFLELTAEEWKRKPVDYKSTRPVPASDKQGAYRRRMACSPANGYSLTQVYITDQKRTDPPALSAEPAAPVTFERECELPQEPAPRKAASDPKAEQFQALRAQLKAGVRVVSAPQLFPTPAWLAKRMVELACIEQGDLVLEPEFGTQAILRAIRNYAPSCIVTGVEISYALAKEQPIVCAANVVCADFLECNDLGQFDCILMNPPFANGQDIAHIKHALQMLKPRGRMVAICADGPRQSAHLRPLIEARGGKWEALPPDTFVDSGTQVRTVLITLTA